MRERIPLSDEDKMPLLECLCDALREYIMAGESVPVVLGCSLVQKGYREILRSGDPCYKLGTKISAMKFVHLDAKAEVLAERLNKRAAEGKYFMPAKLLQSQLDLLQIDNSEGIFKATLSPGSYYRYHK